MVSVVGVVTGVTSVRVGAVVSTARVVVLKEELVADTLPAVSTAETLYVYEVFVANEVLV